MQQRYNKALNHFYQASTNKYMKLDNASDGPESDASGEDDTMFNLPMSSVNGFDNSLGEKKFNNNQLMPSRKQKKRSKVIPVQPSGICSKRNCFYLLIWFLLFLLAVIGLTYFIQRLLEKVPVAKVAPLKTTSWIRGSEYNKSDIHGPKRSKSSILPNVVPCNDFKTRLIWFNTMDKLTTETAVRKIDVNLDNIDDFIIGFGTGVDGFGVPMSVCQRYFPTIFPCFGGALAIDGRYGTEIWRHYSQHEIFAVNCNGDLNVDGVPDCLLGGRASTFEAISGKDGSSLWKFHNVEKEVEAMNFYTAQFIKDLDGDGILDVLNAFGGDPWAEAYSKKRLTGRLILFSGKTGKILKMEEVPDKKETYFSPLVYSLKNGTDMVIFGTGGETHPGGLWIIPLLTFYRDKLDHAVKIFSDETKGIMNPPVLVDVNRDGQEDIVMAAFGSSTVALDGATFEELWRTDFPNSESYSVPGAGYFNEDDVPDFMVRYNEGTGFPVYYHSNLTILDGKTGKYLTSPYLTSGAANDSPLSVSVEGLGNDLYVYWIADCLGHEGEGGEFHFVKGTNVHEQSRADTCSLRFNTKGFSKVLVMNRETGFPGVTLYYSEDNFDLEHKGRRSFKDLKKRHIGVPDHGGFQRIISTGTLATPIVEADEDGSTMNAIDVVFAVFWSYPAKVRLMVEKVWKCVQDYRKKAAAGKLPNNIDLDKNRKAGHFDEGDTAVDFCFKAHNVSESDKNRLYNSQSNYDPTNIHMGKMTVYRYRIECLCKNLPPGKRCGKILPVEEQGWGGYMGSLANGYFNENSGIWSRRVHSHS